MARSKVSGSGSKVSGTPPFFPCLLGLALPLQIGGVEVEDASPGGDPGATSERSSPLADIREPARSFLAFQAPLPNGLMVRPSRDGIVLQTGSPTAGSSAERVSRVCTIETTGYGVTSEIRPTAPHRLVEGEQELWFEHEHFDEWYALGPNGLEHGWLLRRPPEGAVLDGEITIQLTIGGDLVPIAMPGHKSCRFVDSSGSARASYEGFTAWSDSGRQLPLTLSVEGHDLLVTVSVQRADFPVTIDPFMCSDVWSTVPPLGVTWFGHSVSSAGDVNGDGFDEIIIGAPLHSGSGGGAAFLHYGSPTGPEDSPSWSVVSSHGGGRYGWAVSGAGDVNGDGYDDVIVGSPFYSNGQYREGAVFLYLGSQQGLAPTAARVLESDQAGAEFGFSLAMAGDLDADGFGDIIVGAPKFDGTFTDEGRAFSYMGSAGGLIGSPTWSVDGQQSDALFGYAVGGGGDVNGDGFDDVLVGAVHHSNGQTAEGAAYCYSGGSSGLSTTHLWQTESDQQSAFLGYDLAIAGDVDQDGFDDVIVGAPRYDNGQVHEGAAFLFMGSITGPELSPVWFGEGNYSSASYGASVAAAGDVNGDGFDDFAVSAPEYDMAAGRVFVYHGSLNAGALGEPWTVDGGSMTAYLGTDVSAAGDVNGDDVGDLVLSGYNPFFLFDTAFVEVYYGSSQDCNGNGEADDCDIHGGPSFDCNDNEVPDECDIASGSSDDQNGNGVPDECDCMVTRYCVSAPNSVGAGATISWENSVSIGTADAELMVVGCPARQIGIFFYGQATTQAAFGNGYLCVAPAQYRLVPAVRSDSSGVVRMPVPFASPPMSSGPGSVVAFSTWSFQYIYRDPLGGGPMFNLSDGVSVTLCP